MGKKLKDFKTRIKKLFKKKSELTQSKELRIYYLKVSNTPMSRFKLLSEKNDLTALRIDETKGDEYLDVAAAELFHEDFFNFKGMSEEYSFLLDLKYQLALIQIKYLQNKGRHYLNQIRSKEAQVQEQEDKLKGGISITDAKTYIEEKMKLVLNLDLITVEDFYSKLDYYGKR